jgi:hypothetical protein
MNCPHAVSMLHVPEHWQIPRLEAGLLKHRPHSTVGDDYAGLID